MATSSVEEACWFPLSVTQRSRCFVYELEPRNRGNHNNVFVARLQGSADAAAIEIALRGLIARHPMLRAEVSIELGQRILAEMPFTLDVVDATGMSAEALLERVHADAWAPFLHTVLHDGNEGPRPLLRSCLYVTGPAESVFLLALDHLICDGWSYWLLLEQLGAALSGVETSPDAADAALYRDYVSWQHELVHGPRGAKQLAHWQKVLAGEAAPLRLPFDRRRPAQSSHRQGFVTRRLGTSLKERLQSGRADEGATLHNSVMVALQILLHRYTGQDRIVIGAAVPGRSQSAWKSVVGDFANVLPIRADFDAQPTARTMLRNCQRSLLSALRNQDYPFPRLVEELGVAYGEENPLYQVSFVFQKPRRVDVLARLWSEHTCGEDAPRWGGLTLQPFPIEQRVGQDSRVALTLHAVEIDDDARCDFVYDVDVFDAATVERMADHFMALLEGTAADPDQTAQQCPLLSPSERRQLLVELNAVRGLPLGDSNDALIHELFEQQAGAQPDVTAVVFEEQSLTYAELNARANQLAHELIALGVQPDDRVAICAERSLAMVVGLLGILKAGGAYVPLDPASPADRLQAMLRDAQPRVLLTQQALRQALPETALPVLFLDSDAFEVRPTTNPDSRSLGLTVRNLAYVIYTSGSTGTPKGVMIEQRSVLNLWKALERLDFVDAGVSARIGLNASIGFDASLQSLLQLLSGHCLVVFPQSVRADAEAFLRYAQLHALDAFDCTPAQLASLLQAGLGNEAAVDQPKAVLVGGESIGAPLWQSLQAVQSTRFFNVYGPTECTVDATVCALDEAGDRPVIGRPLSNVTVYILDAHGEPVPLGVQGELYIGGVQVARGYLNRPELTAERFLRDPFQADPNARMYKTGDLGRWLPDGNIEYLGRNDSQVKIRGYRVELGEIEVQLSQCVGVREAVVIAREDGAGDKRLVAYLVPQDGASLDAAALRAALQLRLPEYMLPSAFVVLEALPLTPNGKLDRKALPAPETTALSTREYEAPRGEVEQTLATLWQDLLRIERVGRHDRFFELGGHSLLAMQVTSHVRAAFGVELPLRQVFANSTLSALAEVVRAAGASTLGRIQRADRSQALPLSPAQQRLWFLDQLDPAASAAHYLPAALRLVGQLDVAALRATLDRLVARHESLRTSFVARGGVPYQQIAPEDCGFALSHEDVSLLAAGEREAVVARLAAEEARAPFDLSTGPLIRGRLLRVSDDEHVLLVTQHHIVTDGWSIDVMVREVAVLYTAFRNGEADPLPPLDIQYADYAQWQRDWLQGEELTRQVDFWQQHLAGAPALLELPFDRPRPAVQSYAGSTGPVTLSPELTANLRAFSRRHGVTPFMTLLAGWGLLLSRLSGQQDVVIGTPVANRQRHEVENLIGFFVNTLAVRLRFDEQPSAAALLAQVKATTLAAFAHQELPFEQVVEAVQPQRSLSHSPLTQVTFTWNNLGRVHGDGSTLQLPGLELAPVNRAHETTQVDLQLLLDDAGDAISGVLVYARDLFDGQTIERWIGHFVQLLEAMVSDASVAAATLPLLSAAERRQLLETFNDTDVDYPSEALIHELFAQQAAQQPDAVAVVDENESLTYGELNERANQLAHYLIGLGVKADDRVAICCERNADLIVGLLGILKAGGAYVPLDPSHPRDRLAWMLEDSAPVALLTQADLEELLPETELPVLRLDVDLPVLARRLPSHNPVVSGLHARHLAYVIYTSGSTGTPKGVMVEHRSVNRLVINNPYFSATSDDCFAHCANPTFDAATWEIWGALLNGARLLVLPPSVVMEPAQLNARLRAGGVTALWLTVGLFNQYVDRLPDAFGQLRYLLVGGDALDPRTIRQLLESDQRPAHVINGYGPTETTTFACTHDIREVAAEALSIPLGKPIANTRIYVLDGHGQLVPVGVEGEIHIGGDGVARGYLNRAELTAERFLVDPFRADAGARMYKTGDRGRWLADGTIEYLGRNDHQVKIRGFRVELGEIEAALSQCAGVRDAVVLAREDAPGDKRLVAYLVGEEGLDLLVADLRDALSRQLPEYMLPSAFVQLDRLPLTANGKLDRRALPAPEATALSAREYEAPQGEIEQALATLWQELLRVERVGRHDQFFELGGHSLLAVQLISHIRATLGVELPLRELFAGSSLSVLAEAARAAGASTMGRIQRADRTQPLPLSLAQQRLWFLHQLDPAASAAYHMPAALRLVGQLDVAALQTTLDRLVARHESLRTSFVAKGGVPYQQIAAEDCGFALSHEDVSSLSAGEREALVARLTVAEARAPFDLSTGPLIRGRLLRVRDDEHVLLVTQHHIVTDGWSVDVMVREVAALYTAFRNGEADPLPPLEIQYADYAQWQRDWLQGEELARQVDFWQQHLAAAPELLELPLDRPRPAVQSYAGSTVPVTLSPELTANLRDFSQRHGVTPFMTLFAGWGLLLSRLSGQRDIVIGTPVANRQRREVENLIGFFVNTLAVRLRFDEQPTVAALLAQVKQATLAAFAHQDLPFEQVVEAVQPQRSLSHSPLAQVTFTWNNREHVQTDGSTLQLPGLALAPVSRANETIQVDLQMLLDDAGGAISGVLVYARDLFDGQTIERWIGHFVQLLEAMVSDASVAAGTLPLLSAAERRQLLETFNDTNVDYPSEALIHELFEQQAAQQPAAVAVVDEDESLTYGELNERANKLAHYLIGLGVKADDRVAICCERNADLIVGLLGILKAGGAYVPLDPSHPRDRLAWMIEDSAPVALLIQAEVESLLPETELPTLRLDVDLPVLARRLPAHNPAVSGLHSRHLAYVIYTSGSTGTPKGVMVEHRSVNRLVINNPYFSATSDDCFAHCANPTFDAATWEIWGALLNGARSVVLPQSVVMEPAQLNARLRDGGVTALWLTVGLFNQYVDSLPDAFGQLRYLLVGGDALDPRTIRQLLQREQRPAHVVNGYGPTETTTFACTHDIGEVAAEARSIPLGKPIANTRIYVLDGHGQPVPVGVEGEIHIGGDGVARGYLNRAELTAERFLVDPFSAGAGARMYKTGDRGRWLADGTLEYLGRNDFQVKIRGFRVELGEIEAKLNACAGIREAIVVAREDAPGDKRLVAYLVAHESAELSVSDLREALSRQLPEYMVPSAFVQLDALPLTANGKVDRKALPAPEATALSVREYEAPQGEIEEAIAALWQEQLKVPRVGRHDNFFELGGHSLLAVQLISHIRAALGVEVPLRDLFASPSLAALAEGVRAAGASTMGRIQRADRNQPLPLSLAQQRLWFLAQFGESASAAYHMPAALRLVGNLDVAALRATLDRLVARHESLRTHFVAIDGVPYQRIASDDCGFALRREDLSSLPADERESAVTRLTAEEARSPFDLSVGPLIRGRLLTLADDEHVLLITQHHIVSDGWSLGILVREVAALYTAFRRGEHDPLPPLAVQYADYAQWQRSWLRGEELTRQVEFWREQLTGAPVLLELPLDHSRPAVQSHAGSNVPLVLSPELTARLRALSQGHGVTLFMTLLSAWGLLLSRLSGQQDVVIGTPVANRQRREVEGLIGFFVNTVAMRLRFDGETTVATLLAQVKETTLAAFANQELPFEQVVEAVQPQRSLSHSPLVQTALALDNTADYGDALSLPDLSLIPVEQALATAPYELSLHLSEAGEGLSGSIVYASDLFDRSSVERWAGHYVRLMEAMVADATVSVEKLSLLSASERDHLLGDFNAPDVSYLQDTLIHELFEQQAAARPDAVAVVFEDQSLSYGELDARANRLAQELTALGVRPDDRVAICVERSLEMVVGLLGILKAGGAYVPLDPAYPVERLRYMLEDSAPVALLTHSRLQNLTADLASHAPVIDISAAQLVTRSDQNRSPVVASSVAEQPLSPRHLAYVIYTSGSTGTPKGVMVEHGNVVRLFAATEPWFHFDDRDVWTLFHSYAFDFSVWEMWGALLYGGRLVIVPQETSRSPEDFYGLVCRSGVTILNQTPSAFRQFIAAQRASDEEHHLRHVIFGGEALEVATLEPWFERHDDQRPRLVNMYGITETTVHVTYRPIDHADTRRGGSPIGRRIPDLAIYLLDAHRQPVPIGVVGELYIGGAGVARGYLNRPELSAQRFLADPFAARDGARMYKSGDLGRWLPDGSIEFLGRNDAQVKIRGFRIELGEIEAKLSQCTGVREAVVLAREDVTGDKRLVAYLVAEDGVTLQAAELREVLLSQLPEYMVPSAFVELDALPLTPNGKLDRKALPAPETTALVAREYEAPQDEIEEMLAAIWRELLLVGRVGRHDNFFELGGHSLLAVQLTSRIRATLAVDVPLRELFAQPSLQALAEIIRSAGASTMARIEIVDRSRHLPLSMAQQRLWFLDQLDPAASAAYHLPAALRLLGKLDVAALQATLNRLIARHESLRTSFTAIDGVPYQRIAPENCGFALSREDLSSLSADEKDTAVERLAAEDARAPFDLSTGPLIRGRLLRVRDDEHVLLVTQHHIVTDGWSIGVMVRELAALYTAFHDGQIDPLPPLEIQFADYAQWQRSWLQGEELARQSEFWKNHLSDAPVLLELPHDRARPAMQSHAGGTVPLKLSPELTANLRAFSQRHGVTLFMTLLSAWGSLLSRLSGQEDIVIGTPVANRQRREVENLIGFFVNMLAVRLRFEDKPSVASLLTRVKETTLAAFGHQELPFEQVVETVQPQRSLSHSPLAQVTFTWNNREHGQTDGTTLQLPGLTLASVNPAHETIQVDLQLLLDDAGDVISGVLVYARDLFDRETIERWTGHFARLLEAMVADDSMAIDTLPLLSDAERRQVLETFNDTDVDYPKEALIHELFEQQAAQQPDAVAVVDENESLTYGEINERANKLAHYLIGLGMKADDRVAICCERNADLIVGLLGILKAGGAYVPLDPSHPRDRLAWMIEDSAPVALLIQAEVEALLPETERPVLRLDVDLPVLARRLPSHNPAVSGLHARRLAYVIYTSGSTGTPKGVMVEHRSVNRLVINNPYFSATSEDGFAHCANPSFDAATWEIWGALLNGARLLVLPQSVVMEPAQLNARLRAGGVTALWLTVGLFNQYVDSLPDAFGQLRYLLVGGDALDPKTIRQLLQREQRPAHVINGYGPTETTTFACTHDIGEVAAEARSIPLGKPIANTRIYVLDGHDQPVPVGVEGEIHIGGDGVARGYLNRGELTAERFLVDPFSADTGARMYKTGDRGRWLADGTLEYLGRNDYQVKIRGFRIELGEIEVALSRCAGVRDAVVLAREDTPGDKRLVAYLVGEEGLDLLVADLRDALSRQLPEYMLPSAFVQLDRLPLTANGKLDRRALPAPEATALSVREYEAPQGEIEQALATLWQELLHVERVGRHDQFFELGGHSLLAVQLISHIRATLGVELPLRELFAGSSLSVLAEAVRAAGASTMGRIQRADRTRPLPLSLAQQRLWFLHQLDPAASAAYHMPAELRLLGQLDVAALQATLNRLIARHEGLRTSFIAIDGVPYQQIAPEDRGFALSSEDLSSLSAEDSETAVARSAAEEACAPFDLSTGPLIRGRLLRVRDDEHVLLVTQHHIVTDGWSLEVMVREVAALYTAFHQGQIDPLPPLEIQYADYAQWQRDWLQGEELARQSEFWKDQLSAAPVLLDLPHDRPRPAVQSHAGSTVPVELSPELTANLRELSQRHGVTLFMTLLSAWGSLLSRLSGQQDIVIATPVANRQRREVESLIGFFVNMLAVRLRFEDKPSVASLLARVKETTLAAFANQELPFEQVVEAAQPQRSLSHSPLAQVTFTWNNHEQAQTDGSTLQLPGLTLVSVSPAHQTIQVDLQMLLDDAGGAISGVLVYARDLFDRETIERWTGYFVRLLEAMVADASMAIDTLPLLSDAERRQVLETFNDTGVDYPKEALIHELFEQQAAQQPDAVAVVDEYESLSYGQLNSRANQLAHYLIGLGVKADDRVAICCQRNTDLIVGLLGILKAGGAYVPLDPSHPRDRLAWMLEDSAPVALLIQAEVEELLPETERPVLRLDVDLPVLARRLPVHNPAVSGLHARHLAYVIYTSGSTGTPKGVMVESRSVNRLVINNPYFSATSDDCFAHCANPTFDAATWEIWGALLNGARLLVLPQSVVMEPAQLNARLRTGGVTALWLTVGLFNQYVDSLSDAFGQLRYLLVGGDALDPKTIRQLLQREQRPAHVVNGYGPTETTTFACTHDIGEVAAEARSIPLGKPIANTRIYVLDGHGQPVPVGIEGEIHIGGDGVARGYLNRAELTAERFLVDPFSAEASARMYKTGDRGRWLADGKLEYLGRNDYQVKIRGFRIELGEIEVTLRQCAGVRDAVVLAREDDPGDKRLVAYLAADEGVELSVSDLRDALSRQLPDYMVPSAFVQLDSLPLTANGKVDRQALPTPQAAALSAREYEAPQGEIEEAIAALWQEQLKVPRVGRQDSFFELGGHSLLAVQLISHIRAVLGVELPLRELFARPTLEALAAAVRAAGASTMARIEVADRDQQLPLSLAQQRLWFLAQLDQAASAAYHIPAALRLLGKLDVAALRATLDRLVARHESLRTHFVAIDGVPYQQIAPADCGFELRREDTSALAPEEREAAVARLTAEEARAPFDLSAGPLIRGRLLTLAEDEHVLLITQHHIVTDGWSLNILVRELAALYTAFRRGETDPLPPLAVQYADYAQWQRGWLQGEELTRQIEIWREQLRGAPALLELPLDRSRPAVQSYAGSSVPLVLSPELTANLRVFSQRHGVTLFMTLLSAWGLLLSRLSGQQDVVIGTPVANRQRREVEGLMGFFVNTLALRLRFDEQPTVASLLKQVKETTLAAFAYQELPFEQVVEAVQPARSLSHSPLFQSMLALNNTPDDGAVLSLPDLQLESVEQVLATAQYDLSLYLSDAGEALSGLLAYASDLLDRATVERWAGYYVRFLEAMVADASAIVDTLPILSDAERRRLLVDLNATHAEYPEGSLIHELFEQQAAAKPDAVAVVFEGQSLSYRELDAFSNQLAHELIALGVQPDDRVAICAERSLEMVVGLLGILKAGGAYVPLDPAYPTERLRYMLQDAAPKALLTQQVLQPSLPVSDLPALLLDSDALRKKLSAQPASNPATRRHGLTSRNLAYVIYTSGSTGLPKGVLNEHQGVVNRLWWAQAEYRLRDDDRVLQKTPFSFDVSVWEFFLPLLAGARLVMARPGGHQDPMYLTEVIAREQITTIHFVPSMLPAFLAHANPENARSLRRMLCSGEALPHGVLQDVADGLAHVEVHNLYGPTEAAVDVTAWPCRPGQYGQTVPIGRPIANTQIYILDAHGEPVPVGVAGELYIGGVQVARGYRNRPKLTAERFLRDPFSAAPNARMYRTGDLGRWLSDGNIEYLGRNDFQVKIRGFRIEPGEIEAKLSACAGVREAVVIAREDVAGDQRLVAYLVADEQVALQASELRTALLPQLPAFMVPSAFVQLGALPLTSNGKLDRQALPAPETTTLITREYEAPEGEVEERLAALWQELLRVERVGRYDNFFDLGGHSLLAVRLQSRIREGLLVDVPLRTLIVAGDLRRLGGEVASLQFDKFIGSEMDQELSSMSADELKAILESEKI